MPGEFQHVEYAENRGARGEERTRLIMERRSRAREVVYLVEFLVRLVVDHVTLHKTEARIRNEVFNVALRTRVEVVERSYRKSICKQTAAEVGTEESGTAGDKCAHHFSHLE